MAVPITDGRRGGDDGLRLADLLGRHPDAHVAAIREDGIFIPVPDDVPLSPRHRVVSGRSAIDMVTPPDAEAVIRAWEEVMAEGEACAAVHLRVAPEQLLDVVFVDTRHEHGVLFALFLPAEREGAAAAPTLTEDLSPTVVPRIGRLRKDPRAMIVHADEAATRMLGFTLDELVGERSLAFIHPDDHGAAVESWMEMLTVPGLTHRVRLRHRRADGSHLWVEMSNENRLGPSGDGEVVTEMLDISEELAAQEALRASERLLREVAETMPVGLIQFGPDRQVVLVNDRMRDMAVGAAPGEEVDGHLASILPDDRPALEEALDAVFGKGRPTDLEVRPFRDGEVRHHQVSLRALTDEHGTVTGAVACVTDVTESVRLRDELLRQATIDALSGCHNRAATMAALDALLEGPGLGVGVVFVDLDRFKEVNDTYGHRVGDRVLTSVVERIRTAVRGRDVVGRLGGDEFLVVSPDTPDADHALALAERIEQAASHQVEVDGVRIPVAATVGSAWGDGGRSTAERLVADADGAMYAAKAARTAARVGSRWRRRGDDVGALRGALARDELELHFQPMVTLSDRRTCGHEALLRWRRADQVVAADAFIGAAVRSGLIVELGTWVLERFAETVAAHAEAQGADVRWLVNLSTRELAAGAATRLAEALDRHRIGADRIVVELTEQGRTVADTDAVRGVHQLSEAGVGIALDDFGSGWSSLEVLQRLPLTMVKFDRLFLDGLGQRPRAAGLLRSIREMCGRVGLEVAVEGVETEVQVAELRRVGVELAQGHLLGRPVLLTP